MDKYFGINNYLNSSLNLKTKNYELLKNLKEINNSDIINDITNITKENKINKKFDIIYDIYLKMTCREFDSSKQEKVPEKKNKFNIDKIIAMKKISEEFIELYNEPMTNIGCTVSLPNQENIFEWEFTLQGPADTSFKDGVFFLKILFPDNYPNERPKVAFKTPIYHLNVNPMNLKKLGAEPLGNVCISTLNWWRPDNKIKYVISDVFALFYMSNPDSPYGLARSEEFRNNKALHEEKIKYFTAKYANPQIANKEYEESWDFTYP